MNPKHIKPIVRAVAVIMLFVSLVGGMAIPAHAAPGDVTRISVDSSGAQSNGGSYQGQISVDGRYVAFVSMASNLVADDTNNVEDVFVKDRQTGATVRVSLASLTAAQANGGSGGTIAISGDGRYVAFESSATNLVTVDTNGQSDVFVRDTQTGVTTLVSTDSNGVQGNNISGDVSISGDGRMVAFSSSATNLVIGDTNNIPDIFVHDIQMGTTTRASVDSNGIQQNGSSFSPKISANGRYVVFASGANNLVNSDSNGGVDIFVRDLQLGQTIMASVNSSGVQADGGATNPSISGDGRFVTFSSGSQNLMSEETYELDYVFVRDLQAGTTSLASVYSDGYQMVGWSDATMISNDGRYIAFSFDDKGDGEARRWVYIHNRVSGQTVRATREGAIHQSLSADGRFLVFSSGDNSLVPGDTNGQDDIFVKEMAYPPDLSPTVVSVQPRCGGPGCRYPTGSTAAFSVTFSELVTGVTADDFTLTMSGGISGASIVGVSGSRNEYVVTANIGSGDGNLWLNVLDDDSIQDISLNPLGGMGAGNGNFNTGELYTVDNNLPLTTGILIADPNPVIADSVHYTISFSEEVSGVDISDFAFTTTGNVSGAIVAEVSGLGNSYTVTVNPGSGDGTLRLDLIDNDSIIDVFANPLGGVGLANGNFVSGGVYTIDKNMPVLLSSLRADANPTVADSVHFNLTFSETVTGVDASDFILSTNGLSSASITSVSGSANTYTVTVATGSGNGTLRLDLMDNDSIVDSVNHPLGGPDAGNGNFTVGEAYTINRIIIVPVSTEFRSTGSSDGWVLESKENSNVGGSKNSAANVFKLGDDAQNRQFRSILHFPTYYLPDNAVVTQVILMIKKQDVIGTDPFTTHQNIAVDIRKGYFSNFNFFGSLQLTDFQAPADVYAVGTIQNNPVNGWYWAMLDSRAFASINLTDITQLRLGFQLDDNDDRGDDHIRFYSGNFPEQRDRPHLLIEYYVPK